MAEEVVGRGVIEVEVNDSGVDAGIARIEKTVDNLGNVAAAAGKKASDGINKIAAGGDKAASQVDRTTNNLVGSIQRATAAMAAGTKGTAEYYEALAKSRGANVDTLKPYLAQLQAVTDQTRLAEQANKRLQASTDFLADLKTKAAAVGKTSSELLQMRAAELGVSDAAAPMIAKLRDAEKAASGTNATFNKLSTAAKFLGVSLSLAAAGALVKDVVTLATRYNELGIVVQTVGRNYGYTRTQLDDYELALRKTGITAIESRANIAKMVAANLDLANATKLARIAQDAAVIGGVNSSEAFARLITGIQSAQVDTLRGIGLNANFEASYVKLAASLGKTADQLTEVEKSQARVNSVLELAPTIAGAYEAAMDNAGKQLRSSTRYLEDIKVKFGETFNEALTVAVLGLVSGLKDVNGEVDALAANGKLKEWSDGILDSMAFVADAVTSVGAVFRLTGSHIAEFFALRTNGLDTFFGGGISKQIRAQAEADRAEIMRQTSQFRDALAERRKAQEESAKKRDPELEQMVADNNEFERLLRERKEAIAAHNAATAKERAAAAKKEVDTFNGMVSAIRAGQQENLLEVQIGDKVSESQKQRIKLDQDLATGKLKLTAAHEASIRAELDALAATEKTLKAAQLTKEINQYIADGTAARKESAAQLQVEYELYGKTNDARDIAIISIKAQAAAEEEIAKLKKEGYNLSQDQIQQLHDEAKARAEVEQATLGQSKALTYAKQLADDNRRFSAEYIYDSKARAKALLDIDAEEWQERIRLAGDGTEAQKKLQQEYGIWYANQLNKPALDEWRKSVEQYDDVFRKGFADMVNGGTSSWKSFTKSLVTTFKTTVADYLYKAFARPFVVKIVASLLGITGGGLGIGSAAAAANGVASVASGGVGGFGDILGMGKSLLDGFGAVQGSITSSIEKLGVMLANGNGGFLDSVGGFIGANAGTIGNVLPFAGAALQALTGNIKGAAFTAAGAAIGSVIPGVGTAIGGVVGGIVGSLFGGGGDKSPRLVTSVSSKYANGVFNAGSGIDTNDGGNGTAASQQAVQKAFASSLGALLKGFGLSDAVTTGSFLYNKRGTGAGFNASFDGGSINFTEWSKGKNLQDVFDRMTNQVLGPLLVEAIKKTKLPEGIKSLFEGLTDRTQIGNMISATVSLNSAQKELASRFGLTVDAAGRVSKATGQVGDQLSAFVGKLASASQAFKKPSEALLDAQDFLQKGLNNTFGTVVTDAVWQTVTRQVEVKPKQTVGGVWGSLFKQVAPIEAANSMWSRFLPVQKQFETVTEQVLTYVDRVIPKTTALPKSLDEYDALLKSINTQTAAGAKMFADIFAMRDGFIQFRAAIDGLKNGVDNAVFGLLSPEQQKAKRKAEFDKVFQDLNIPIPGNLQELIALGNDVVASLDNPTEKMLDLAAAFPTLVEAFKQTQDVVDSLTDSVKGTEFFTDLLAWTRYSKLAANYGKDFADRNSTFGQVSQFAIPGFADGGIHMGGLRIVGETGMELEATGPARYYSNAQTKALLQSTDPELVSELRSIRLLLQQIQQDGNSETLSMLMKVDRIAKGIEQLVGDGFLLRDIDNDGNPVVVDVRVVS